MFGGGEGGGGREGGVCGSDFTFPTPFKAKEAYESFNDLQLLKILVVFECH